MARMKQRRKTAANWTSSNEVLLAGEIGLETDTRKVKYGDGTTVWNSLNYAGGGAWGDITGTLSSQTDLSAALALKSPLASPTFTGTPAAPTATAGTNTTQVATTAFARAEIARLATGSLSAKDYGAKGDGKLVTDASISGTTVTSATAAFTSADVGKVCWAVAGGLLGGNTQLAQTTITAYNSATSVTVGTSGTTGSSNTFIWGTDDTTVLQTAWDAAISSQRPLYLPAGIYLVSGSIGGGNLNSGGTFHLVGDGVGQTVLRLTPTAAWISGKNGIITCPSNSLYNSIRDLEIHGGACSRLATQTSAVTSAYAAGLYWNGVGVCERVKVTGFSSNNGFDFLSFNGLHVAGTFAASFRDCEFTQNGVNIKFTGSCDQVFFERCRTASNGAFQTQSRHNLLFETTACTRFRFLCCEIDESTLNGETVSFSTAASVTGCVFDQCTIYVMTSTTGILIDESATVTLTLRGSQVVPYGGNTNCTAINVRSGQTVTIEDCTITGNGTGKCVTGAGTLKKRGDNTLTGTVDVTTNTTQY
jgi:hypothetical protein